MTEKEPIHIDLNYIDWLLTRIVRISILLILTCVMIRSFFQERAFELLERTLLNRIYLLECRMETTEEAIPALRQLDNEPTEDKSH